MYTTLSLVFILMIFIQTLGDLHREGVTGEELFHRMASKWEKVVDKAGTISLGSKLIFCDRSISWWDEELHQLVGLVLLRVQTKIVIRVIT